MKNVLNLYCGIGGNRKNWENVNVTAIEFNEDIALIYKDLFPEDNVIVCDANEYLLKNYKNFEFIWSSPPCQSHSKVRFMASKSGTYLPKMPEMKLWSEIIFLKHFCNGSKWVVENVRPYYEPLIPSTQKIGRHLFWSNFEIPFVKINDNLTHNERGSSKKGFFNISKYKTKNRKDQIVRNCVDPEIGEYIFKCAFPG
jgi:DNA (cytosine-5)-methyltransferase 1